MPVRKRRPEDEQPLFRAVNEQRLIAPVVGGQNGAPQAEEQGGAGGGVGTEQAASQASQAGQGGKGPIARALDRAQENNWVYDSVANKVRENGLADKADEFLSRLTGR